DIDGNYLMSRSVVYDITERKRVEGALKLSEERLDLALEAGDIGTFDWDIRSGAVVWTEKMKAMFGLPSGKTIGVYEGWRDRVHPEDLPATEASIQDAFEKRRDRWSAEYRMIPANSEEVRWIESMSRIFYDAKGAPLRMIGTNLDVTDRKRAEEAIR